MKNNKLLDAMGHLDETLVNEALTTPHKKKFPVGILTAAAAAVVLMALSAGLIVNVNKRTDQIIAPSTPVQSSENVKESTAKEAPTSEKTESPVSSLQTSKAEEISQASVPSPKGDEEESDMLGFLIRDGKTYMQILSDAAYTKDQDIGRAGEFQGYYHELDDNSRVYTVKEDDRILVIEFEHGGSVTLMLWEEDSGEYPFHGLRVDRSLMAALASNDGKAYSIYVTRPDSEDMYDFEYNGKTLRTMKAELEESWKTQHGKHNPLEVEYQAALDAFLRGKIRKIYDIMVENGIRAELINGVRCDTEMTKSQLEAFAAANSHLDEYLFCLSSGNYGMDDRNA